MKTNHNEIIWKCMEDLRSYFAYEDCNKILIYLIFLKYIVDNKKLPLNNDTFELFLDTQRMLDKGKLDKDLVSKMNYVIENFYSIPQGSLSDFSNLFFRATDTKKIDDEKLFAHLTDISFENESENIISSIKYCLWQSALSFGRMMGNEISSKSLSNLIGTLLNLKDNENYADLSYGIGLSSLEITKNIECSITGYEINRITATMAQMFLIISSQNDWQIHNCDSTIVGVEETTYDKIAISPPLGVKVRELTDEQKLLLEEFELPLKASSIEVLMILKSIKSLKKTGKLVVTITPNILFSATAVEKGFRELISRKYLTTVINLPALNYGTNVNTVLLVLEKNRRDDLITFIDASNNENYLFTNKDNKAFNEVAESGITKIDEICNNQQEICGISKVCTVCEIEDNDFLLSPVKYVQVIKNEERLSNQEIDEKLKVLYENLKEIIK